MKSQFNRKDRAELDHINKSLSDKAQQDLLKHLELIPSDKLRAKLSAKAQLELLEFLGLM